MKRKGLLFIILAIFTLASSAQTLHSIRSEKVETRQCDVPRLLLINDELDHIMDKVVIEFNRCEKHNLYYPLIVTIQLNCVEDREDFYCITISRSMFYDATGVGYGFFYYKGLTFIVQGVQCKKLFKETSEKRRFDFYKDEDEPCYIFDPPRWLYIYDGKSIFEIMSSPCGG